MKIYIEHDQGSQVQWQNQDYDLIGGYSKEDKNLRKQINNVKIRGQISIAQKNG